MPVSEVTNEDCMIMMDRYPDKFFELAIVDPPYGLGEKLTNGGSQCMGELIRKKAALKGGWPFSKMNGEKWDIAPNELYFLELFRVSKNQCIWGANHYDYLPGTECFLIWDKKQPPDISFSMCEYAWTSFIKRPQVYYEAPIRGGERTHPTQKSIWLYDFIINYLAKPGDKILDTHLGSGSSRIAAYKLGFDFYSCELDKDYFEAQEKRFAKAINEPLFQTQPTVTQSKLL